MADRRAGAVLVISSHVARGSVGNRAMVFALERLGFPVWAVPTVLLPHHPGHGRVEKIPMEDAAFAALLDALLQDGRAADIAGLISGYLVSPAQALTVRRIVETVKVMRSDALYLCDPVIGVAGNLYVGAALAGAIRDALLPLADIATPNAFECSWLAGASGNVTDLAGAARSLPPPATLVTSAPALMRGAIGNLLVTRSETILFEHPRLATAVKGTGDLLAALLLAGKLGGQDWSKVAEAALSSVFEIVAGTAKAGGDELMLSELQGSLIHPHAPINVRRMRNDRALPAGR
jgi:pyridoxine kinase